jgi:mannose-6-phosphate isomerase-like protein (cupin superfamily)
MLDLKETYVHFEDGGRATAIPVTDQFWPDVMAGTIELGGRLVTVGTIEEDWTTWEMHPEGEELVVLLRGDVELVVEREGVQTRHRLREPGQACLNRRGDWHRVIVHTPGQLLFITHGPGTQHRPV